MQIIKQSELKIKDLSIKIKQGCSIIYPTETCYGLGCDATNQGSVDKIFLIKERSKNKSVLILVSDILMAKKYLIWNDKIEKLANKFWPGPLTIVGISKSKNGLANGVMSDNGTIAVRVTANNFCKKLIKKLGIPLVSTSANISEMGNQYNIENIIKMFLNKKNKPDIIIDAGVLLEIPPSTIVSVVGDEMKVLRQGEIRI